MLWEVRPLGLILAPLPVEGLDKPGTFVSRWTYFPMPFLFFICLRSCYIFNFETNFYYISQPICFPLLLPFYLILFIYICIPFLSYSI